LPDDSSQVTWWAGTELSFEQSNAAVTHVLVRSSQTWVAETPFASAHASTYGVPLPVRPWQVDIPALVAQIASWPAGRQVPGAQSWVIPVAHSFTASPSHTEVTPACAHETAQWGTGAASQLAHGSVRWKTWAASQV
jgi:hypothetical protein